MLRKCKYCGESTRIMSKDVCGSCVWAIKHEYRFSLVAETVNKLRKRIENQLEKHPHKFSISNHEGLVYCLQCLEIGVSYGYCRIHDKMGRCWYYCIDAGPKDLTQTELYRELHGE